LENYLITKELRQLFAKRKMKDGASVPEIQTASMMVHADMQGWLHPARLTNLEESLVNPT
jgi:hypothetical protein